MRPFQIFIILMVVPFALFSENKDVKKVIKEDTKEVSIKLFPEAINKVVGESTIIISAFKPLVIGTNGYYVITFFKNDKVKNEDVDYLMVANKLAEYRLDNAVSYMPLLKPLVLPQEKMEIKTPPAASPIKP